MSTSVSANSLSQMSTDQGRALLIKQVEGLGEWFHNIDLLGVATAPRHFLGDFPNVKWKHIAPEIPNDLRGATVLDIGCNGGFYSIEMKKRGASLRSMSANRARATTCSPPEPNLAPCHSGLGLRRVCSAPSTSRGCP